MPSSLYAVFSRPPEGLSFEDYSRWYEAHVAENIRTPGFRSAQRYAVQPVNAGTGADPSRSSVDPAALGVMYSYLAIYELDSDLGDVRADLARRVAQGEIVLPEWFKDISFGSWNCVPVGEPVEAPPSAMSSTVSERELEQGALEERLQRLEDSAEIRELQMAYGRYLDAKDWLRYAELFAEDGEIVAGLGTTKGPQAIRELFENALRDVDSGFHVFTNLTIVVDGDEATARSLWFYLCPDETGWPTVLQCGHYDDHLVRRDGTWKFKRREAARDMGFPPYAKRT
jgi:ketosteroid isomerase-like protein